MIYCIHNKVQTDRRGGVSGTNSREKIIALLDRVPEYKIGYVLAYVQGLTADEDADDAFCQQMYERYQSDPEKDEEFTLEECKQEWGLA